VTAATWPWEAILAVAGSLAANLIAFGRWLLRRAEKTGQSETEERRDGWKQIELRDHQIDLLRQVIDRSRRRENAAMTGLELALLAMKLPAEEQAEIVRRIKDILRSALPQRSPDSGEGES
jgi:hypothetical protein